MKLSVFILPLLPLAMLVASAGPAAAAATEAIDADFAAQQAAAKAAFSKDVAPFVKNYCVTCHGNRRTKGDLNLEPALKSPGESSASRKWQQTVANVKAHDMPPDDASKQPTDEERARFLAGVEQIKFLATKDPGPFVIRRLTKAEYANTLHDMFGVDRAVAQDLPDEVFGEGYLNSLSPMQTEQYMEIANEVLVRILAPKGKPPTELQRRLFGRTPATPAEQRTAARAVAQALTRGAYRRPATEAEIDVLLRVYDLARSRKLDHSDGLRLVLKAVLVSPQFLFITPAQEPPAGEKIVPLDDYQLASRLSYLLWATMPDAPLAALADQGKLREPAVLRAQVQRMLADPRSRALFDGFGAQWLGLGEIRTKTFDAAKFPQMTRELRAAMYDEARLFFDSIVRGNRSVVAFVDSDYTFLNATLAPVYGLEKSVHGSDFQKVKLTDGNRGGILAMPGVLATTSFPNRTSAVKRGVWVLEQVLGEEVPPAPPNVPSLEKQNKKQVANLTLRQRTELHRTNAVCANCHKILDPIGFGLENFDAIGRWRATDESGGAIDAAGELPGGKHFSTPKELKTIIAGRQDDLARNLTERLMAYALCRKLEGYDQIVVDRLMKAIAAGGYKVQTLIAEIVTSYPFTHRRVDDSPGTAPR